jgi:hypothetical protein
MDFLKRKVDLKGLIKDHAIKILGIYYQFSLPATTITISPFTVFSLK